MISRIQAVLIICLQLQVMVIASTLSSVSIYCKNRNCDVRPNVVDFVKATAVGTFDDTLFTTGWGVLDISAGNARQSTSTTNNDTMYAAGFAEGFLTARHMDQHYTNMRNTTLPLSNQQLYSKLKEWYIVNRRWTDSMVASNQHDPLWRHVGYILAQQDGLLEGYRAVRGSSYNTLNEFDISFMNGLGDQLDLDIVLSDEPPVDWRKFTAEEAQIYFSKNGHCSALVKILPGFENIFMSHSTWFMYEATNRIYKHYSLILDDPATAIMDISFSSYPGCLESQDDFYILGNQNMVMLQTSLGIHNKTLYNDVHPQSLLSWQRVRVASMMAHDGQEWTNIIKMYNSGTYNNEYMVIDLKKFSPNKPLQDGTLWVADQMPGLVVTGDATQVLRDGYFPSYNIPFFEEAYNKMGYAEFAKVHGTDFTWDLTPRAKIFRRDQANVKSLGDMKNIMRYNDYKNDPYSLGDPYKAICSRADLAKVPSVAGCFDTKVTDYMMTITREADAVNGPTLSHGLPVFSWTGDFSTKYAHEGLPHTYNFTFVRIRPLFSSIIN